ncbi:neutral zinc metallopeptidase [Terrihabitans soli]|uniref:Neutral zinc metallopeptidase n=1 Tax=Terrihabitans soli TaxID=708113 RepID=A0A6S6QGC0_9HYPH|nr:neutral zinc metallopeptidase [Terrihabitans soli]BCJ90183.1 neutral zinc metallopeptidase [Terrihabitans soli]
MRWGDLRRSGNIEDRRGMGGGGGGGFRGGGLGIGGLIIVGLLAWATGIDPRIILGGLEMVQGNNPGMTQQEGKQGAPSDESGQFVSAVLGSTEDVWQQIFQQNGQSYRAPRLVLFENATPSACGLGQAAMGPFYCPPDQRVYLDTGFFKEMERRFNAAGDFAAAYVVAHEVGHHVQNLMGIMERVQQERQRVSRTQSNELSVRTELQADCFAGVWAHHAKTSLEPGDIEEAINAATAIGDDKIQKQTQGTVVPDSFTHGSSAQRVRWFKTGFESGQVKSCNTFAAQSL